MQYMLVLTRYDGKGGGETAFYRITRRDRLMREEAHRLAQRLMAKEWPDSDDDVAAYEFWPLH